MQENKVKVLDISEYNVHEKLNGVGPAILMHVVHEMDDGHDVQQLVCSSRGVQKVMMDGLFPWSLAQVLSKSYPLRTVPVELTVIVCDLLYLTQEFKHFYYCWILFLG